MIRLSSKSSELKLIYINLIILNKKVLNILMLIYEIIIVFDIKIKNFKLNNLFTCQMNFTSIGIYIIIANVGRHEFEYAETYYLLIYELEREASDSFMYYSKYKK